MVLGFCLTVGAGAVRAEAQGFRTAALEATLGWIGFADDGVVSEAMVGGAGRLYATPRLAVGPEVVYIRGNHHSHFVVTRNTSTDGAFTAGGVCGCRSANA
jgi:hypothetical protein